jgi:hypothetical protein
MSRKSCMKKRESKTQRGPRPKEVAAGEADSNGVSKGNIFFDKRRL